MSIFGKIFRRKEEPRKITCYQRIGDDLVCIGSGTTIDDFQTTDPKVKARVERSLEVLSTYRK